MRLGEEEEEAMVSFTVQFDDPLHHLTAQWQL
jgi:hypothetical protein